MSFVQFLFSRKFLRHFLLSILATLIIIFIALLLLSVYTLHGKQITVPDFRGLSLNEIAYNQHAGDLIFIILDSVYNENLPKGSVVLQDPLPGSKVKRNRKIYLTTVAVLPEQVQVPDLVDLTFRQAAATLETYGLKLGKLDYVADIARNAVLRQLYEGKIVEPNTLLERGSQIDLVLGRGLGSERSSVPFLLGLTPSEVRNTLKNLMLAKGAEFFSKPADSSNSRAYKQNPAFKPDAYLNIGLPIDVWYKPSDEFNFDSLLQIYQNNAFDDYDSIFIRL
ncbi:MAG: PASTA domain-containing protein [Bacteroidales bacterium]|nr:PASTA domain-containing protein [Bacteroidales bacterium]MDZ4203384.1 PASTA domain-containing protein [Bacteroidales bacterium]